MFDELQSALQEQEEADATADRIDSLVPGDADYDAIRICHAHVSDPDAATRLEMSNLVTQWTVRHKELETLVSELHGQLHDAGYDLNGYFADNTKNKMRRLEKDPAEQQHRREVDLYLNKKYPQQLNSSVSISTFVSSGAAGYRGVTDDQELAEVHVLDSDASVGEGDCPVDKLTYHSADADVEYAAHIDDSVVNDGHTDVRTAVVTTGAVWFKGFRLSHYITVFLRDHQTEAVQCALQALLGGCHGTLIAHGMGLGKSFSTLVILHAWSTRFQGTRAVVVCPKSMTNQWAREASVWHTLITIDTYTVTGSDDVVSRTLKPWLKYGGVVFVGYDQFKRSLDKFNITDQTIVVIDEAHLLKQKQTNLYQTIKGLPTRRRIFLTGSPVQNQRVLQHDAAAGTRPARGCDE